MTKKTYKTIKYEISFYICTLSIKENEAYPQLFNKLTFKN